MAETYGRKGASHSGDSMRSRPRPRPEERSEAQRWWWLWWWMIRCYPQGRTGGRARIRVRAREWDGLECYRHCPELCGKRGAKKLRREMRGEAGATEGECVKSAWVWDAPLGWALGLKWGQPGMLCGHVINTYFMMRPHSIISWQHIAFVVLGSVLCFPIVYMQGAYYHHEMRCTRFLLPC